MRIGLKSSGSQGKIKVINRNVHSRDLSNARPGLRAVMEQRSVKMSERPPINRAISQKRSNYTPMGSNGKFSSKKANV
jgi:hypothetical protein